MKAREVIKRLKADGWYEVRTKGSHRAFRHATIPGTLIVPDHQGQDVHPDTLRSIYKQAGLEPPGRSNRGPT